MQDAYGTWHCDLCLEEKDWASIAGSPEHTDICDECFEMLDSLGVDPDNKTARCRACDESTELPIGLEEIEEGFEHWCGRSPMCCP